VSLHRLESDRFASSRLDGMLANVWADLPAKDLVGSTMLKSITGGDVISSERKYHDSYNLATFCRLIFSANSPPRTPDADAAFFSRWTVIPFGRSFRGLEGEVPSDVLDARLADPAELSGLLNRALECLPAVRARGLSEPPSLIAARNAFRAATDPVAVWIDEHTVTDPEGVVAKRALLDAFNRDARAAGDPVLTANAFGRAMRRSRPTVSMSQRRLDGRPVEVWTGISLASDASAP
jgi:phage/plasmid-associated DNA primase